MSEEISNPEELKNKKPEQLLRGDKWFLPPEIGLGEEIAAEIERRLFVLGWTDNEVGLFPLATHEAFINGVVHGIFEEKIRPEEEDLPNKKDLLNMRTTEKELRGKYKDKKVTVSLNLTPEEATVVVKDEGKGFSVEAIPDPTNLERLLEPTGRGVDLMKKVCDRVSFEGNTVILYKKKNSTL